jgi:hypothetical protein
MNIIMDFKNLEEEEKENCPLADEMREVLTNHHDSFMAIVSLDALKEPEEPEVFLIFSNYA